MYYVQYAQVCRCVYYTCMRILQCVSYTCSRLVALRASQQSTLLDPRQFHAQLLRAGALGLGLVQATYVPPGDLYQTGGLIEVPHDPARPRYCSTAVAVWGDVTPSGI